MLYSRFPVYPGLKQWLAGLFCEKVHFLIYKRPEVVFLSRPTRVKEKDAPLVPGWRVLMIRRYRARGNPVK